MEEKENLIEFCVLHHCVVWQTYLCTFEIVESFNKLKLETPTSQCLVILVVEPN